MDDNRIIELYWERKEEAINETALKYGGLCTYIARNILSNYEDSEECVNDTYFAVWNAIPKERPIRFSAFRIFPCYLFMRQMLKKFTYD